MKCIISKDTINYMNYKLYKQMVLHNNVNQSSILCKTLRINNIDYDCRLIQNMH